MIISKTPYRVSFFGGGTDYPKWYKNNKKGGKTISCSIDKFSYIVLKKLPNAFKYKYRIRYLLREEIKNIKRIKHPTIRNIFKILKINIPLEIIHYGDLPAATGVGSSSAFTVGLLNAFNQFFSYKWSKKKIYQLAVHIEQNLNKENVGSQDQIISSLGGFRVINFKKKNIITSDLKQCKKNLSKIENNSFLIYSGIQRESSLVTKDLISNINKKGKTYKKLYELTIECEKLIKSKNFSIEKFGKLLNESWNLKKTASKLITNKKINEICSKCLKNKAIGVKLLGAGSGGFVLVVAKKNAQLRIKKMFKKSYHFPLKISYGGSKIICHE